MKVFVRVVTVGALLAIAGCGGSTESSATDAPATDPPPTAAPATDPPATDPPATDPPPTDPPATDPPATDPPPTDPPPTDPPETDPPVTDPPVEPIVIGEPGADGSVAVAIDGTQLDPLFDNFVDSSDPYFHVHTQQDDIFVGVELYTLFGAEWTGELGTFPTDCTTHGICVYLDPDGSGPLPGGGPAVGTITVEQLDGSSIITLDDVTITAEDGQVYTMSGVTLTG